MKRDTSPFRYVRWFAFDLLRTQVLLYALVSLVLAIVVWRIEAKLGAPIDVTGLQKGVFTAGLTVVVLMAIGGSIGTDLSAGYYRAWFSKPMTPAWFYLQRWLLAGLAVLCAPLLLGGALALILHRGTGITADLMLTVALGYFLIASATLLVSNFTPRDWLIVFVVAFVEHRLSDFIELSERGMLQMPGWLVTGSKFLPPFHLVSANQPLLHGAELAHVLGYGAGMLVLGLLLVQLRPLGSGGRA